MYIVIKYQVANIQFSNIYGNKIYKVSEII